MEPNAKANKRILSFVMQSCPFIRKRNRVERINCQLQKATTEKSSIFLPLSQFLPHCILTFCIEKITVFPRHPASLHFSQFHQTIWWVDLKSFCRSLKCFYVSIYFGRNLHKNFLPPLIICAIWKQADRESKFTKFKAQYHISLAKFRVSRRS